MKPVTIAIILILILIIAFTVAASQDKPEMIEATYTVKKGDTLWSIAERYCPNTMDKREYIWIVQKINNLSQNTYLIPNAEIKILKEVSRIEE